MVTLFYVMASHEAKPSVLSSNRLLRKLAMTCKKSGYPCFSLAGYLKYLLKRPSNAFP